MFKDIVPWLAYNRQVVLFSHAIQMLSAASSSMTCAYCHHQSVAYDHIEVHGLVCSNCGTVVDDSLVADDVLEFNRDSRCPNGLLIDQIVGERGGVAISRPGSIPSRPRHFSVIHHDTNVQRDRRVTSASRRLEDQVEIVINSLKLPQHLFADVKGLTLKAVGSEITKQKKVDVTIAVCTYIACRRAHIPVQLLDVADVISMNVFKLGSQYKKISQRLNIKLEVQDPAILAEKVISEMNESLEKLDQIAKMKLMNRTIELVRVACKEWLDTGRKPISIVAAAVKIVVTCEDINLNINEMAKALGVGSLSIRDRHRELQNLLLKLASNLPWAKEITKKTLPQYLPFILEYLQSLRKLHRIPMKELPKEEVESVVPIASSPLPPTDKELPIVMEHETIQDEELSSSILSSSPNPFSSSPNTILPSSTLLPSLSLPSSPTSTTSSSPSTTKSTKIRQPVIINKKRKSRISQQKSVDMILGQITEIVPPSFVRSQLERQTRIKKITRAKKRISNEQDSEPIDQDDISIEKLLRAGASDQAIEDGYYHVAVQITNTEILDSEELFEEDLQEGELEKYTKSKEQIAREIQIRELLGDDIDGEISRRRAKKKQRLE